MVRRRLVPEAVWFRSLPADVRDKVVRRGWPALPGVSIVAAHGMGAAACPPVKTDTGLTEGDTVSDPGPLQATESDVPIGRDR